MSCAVGSTCPSGGRRSTHSCVPSRDRVREVRAAARDQRRRAAARRRAPATCAANYGRSRVEIDTSGVVALRRAWCSWGPAGGPERRPVRSGDPRGARLHGLAVALGVAGDPADGHVDAEAGRGALLFGLAAPEAVLAVLAGPVAAVDEDGALRQTARALLSRTTRASGRSPAGAKNSSVRPSQAASSVQDRGPVKIRFESVSIAMTNPCGSRGPGGRGPR